MLPTPPSFPFARVALTEVDVTTTPSTFVYVGDTTIDVTGSGLVAECTVELSGHAGLTQPTSVALVSASLLRLTIAPLAQAVGDANALIAAHVTCFARTTCAPIVVATAKPGTTDTLAHTRPTTTTPHST